MLGRAWRLRSVHAAEVTTVVLDSQYVPMGRSCSCRTAQSAHVFVSSSSTCAAATKFQDTDARLLGCYQPTGPGPALGLSTRMLVGPVSPVSAAFFLLGSISSMGAAVAHEKIDDDDDESRFGPKKYVGILSLYAVYYIFCLSHLF